MCAGTAPVSNIILPTVVDLPWSICPITARFRWGFSDAILFLQMLWDCPLTVSLCESYIYGTHLYKLFRFTNPVFTMKILHRHYNIRAPNIFSLLSHYPFTPMKKRTGRA